MSYALNCGYKSVVCFSVGPRTRVVWRVHVSDPAQDLLKHSERDFLKGQFSVMGASTRPKMSPSWKVLSKFSPTRRGSSPDKRRCTHHEAYHHQRKFRSVPSQHGRIPSAVVGPANPTPYRTKGNPTLFQTVTLHINIFLQIICTDA